MKNDEFVCTKFREERANILIGIIIGNKSGIENNLINFGSFLPIFRIKTKQFRYWWWGTAGN